MADLRGGASDTPLWVQILSISCSFLEILAKSYVGAPLGEVGVPTSGKSWIHHWLLLPGLMVYPYRQLSLYCTFHKGFMTFNQTGDAIYVYELSRCFPKVDHSGINARSVLEQIEGLFTRCDFF